MNPVHAFFKKHVVKTFTDMWETSEGCRGVTFLVFGLVLAGLILSLIPREDSHNDEPIWYDIELKQLNQTGNNDYVIIVSESDPLLECPIEDARFSLFGLERQSLFADLNRVSDINGTSIDNETFIAFHDNDDDGNISMGDVFLINSVDHVDDDGNPSPGYAGPGCVFEVRGNNVYMAEIELK